MMHQFDKEIAESGGLSDLLRPGTMFPDFKLPNQYSDIISLSNLLKRGPLVISFFRGIWCPYCNFELQTLQQSLVQLERTGASLIAISPQLPCINKRTIHENRLRFDLLSDKGCSLSEKVGIAYLLSNVLIEKVQQEFKVDLSTFNGNKSWLLPISSRFVIDKMGTIVSSDAYVNYQNRPETSETVTVVKAITRRTTD